MPQTRKLKITSEGCRTKVEVDGIDLGKYANRCVVVFEPNALPSVWLRYTMIDAEIESEIKRINVIDERSIQEDSERS